MAGVAGFDRRDAAPSRSAGTRVVGRRISDRSSEVFTEPSSQTAEEAVRSFDAADRCETGIAAVVDGAGKQSCACRETSDKRRVGEESVTTCRNKWTPEHNKKKKT